MTREDPKLAHYKKVEEYRRGRYVSKPSDGIEDSRNSIDAVYKSMSLKQEADEKAVVMDSKQPPSS